MADGAATANPAAAKKHRRVSERFPEMAIGSSFPTVLIEPLESGIHSVAVASMVPNSRKSGLAGLNELRQEEPHIAA